MDKLTITISPCRESCYNEGGVYFLVTVFVNGERLLDVLDVDVFFTSLDSHSIDPAKGKRGRKADSPAAEPFPLFTCDCGVFDCGIGEFMDVTLRPDALIWENAYARHIAPLRASRLPALQFSWQNVRDVAGELIAAIYAAQAQSTSGEVWYGATGVEVTARLPYYLERYEALPV